MLSALSRGGQEWGQEAEGARRTWGCGWCGCLGTGDPGLSVGLKVPTPPPGVLCPGLVEAAGSDPETMVGSLSALALALGLADVTQTFSVVTAMDLAPPAPRTRGCRGCILPKGAGDHGLRKRGCPCLRLSGGLHAAPSPWPPPASGCEAIARDLLCAGAWPRRPFSPRRHLCPRAPSCPTPGPQSCTPRHADVQPHLSMHTDTRTHRSTHSHREMEAHIVSKCTHVDTRGACTDAHTQRQSHKHTHKTQGQVHREL